MKKSPVQKAALAIEWWPTDKPKPYKQNARKISDRAIDKVAGSLKEFGWRQPIVVNAKGIILAGHTRQLAARKLGMSQVPVHVATGLTAAQERAYRLMDNRSAAEATWDEDLLALELGELKGLDLDLSLTGFDTREVDKLLAVRNPAEDDAPPLPVAPVSQLGDVWLLGPHRLACGDATNAEAVKRACGATKPVLMVTDPPYGVEYDAEWRQDAARAGLIGWQPKATLPVRNDDRKDWSEAYRLFAGDVAYVWHASIFGGAVAEGIAAEGIAAAAMDIRSQIIWAKPTFAIGRGHYHWQHEACWYAVRKGKQGHWNGDRSQTTLWSVPVIDGDRTGHSTQKPVEIMRRPILNHTKPGQHVYDPFMGSGSSLIAAETSDRVSIGLEIDPRYVDVAVIRWQNLTGKQATLEGAHGQTFEHVKAGRRLRAEDAIKEEVLATA